LRMGKSWTEWLKVGGRDVGVRYNAGARAYFIRTAGYRGRFGRKTGEKVLELLNHLSD